MLRMEYDLKVEQSQKLVITPELKQAINILQLSALDLSEYLEQQVAENPVLEMEAKEQEEKLDIDQFIEPGIDWRDVFSDKSDLGEYSNPREETASYSIEHYLSTAPTLLEHLSLQLGMLELTPVERKIGEYLLGNIDHNGYLRIELAEVSKKFGCNQTKVQEMIKLVQSFDPPGVGARNLVECLLLQLKVNGNSNPTVEVIIKNHLVDLAEGKVQKIARRLNITPQEVQEAAQVIKRLDPKPGRLFAAHDKPKYIVPDLIVEKIDGEYVILVNDSALPRITVNPVYETLLKMRDDLATVQYIEQKLNSALWLLRSVEQRRLTLYRVAQCIVDYQRDFLEKGIKFLKPLTLAQVAEKLGVHESTVSRATANKYMQTPRGLFELKFFFTNGLETNKGVATSSESVKVLLKELVEKEDTKEPLSDQKLAEMLVKRGINISRRTVAKYRGEMGIPTALQRKIY